MDASFVSAAQGWLAARRGFWRTTDGGATWSKLPPLPTDGDHVRFATSLVGYAWATGGQLYVTTDGGHSWTVQALDRVLALETAGGVVWALAGEEPYPTIWRAAVGSGAWTAIAMTPDRSATLDVHGATAYVTGQQGAGPIPGSVDILDATSKPGATPTNVHTPCTLPGGYAEANPLGVSTDGSLVMACVGQSPDGRQPNPRSAYISHDRARTWTPITGPPEDPADVTAIDGAVFAWGRDLHRYADHRWQRVLVGPSNGRGFVLVGFQDDRHGITIDAGGRVSLTRDGGLTWTAATPGGADVACGDGALAVRRVERVSAATGEHAFVVQLTNVSARACTTRGFPDVRFFDERGRPLELRVQHGGGAYVTGRAPALVEVAPGDHAFVEVAKYRCDVTAQDTAVAADLLLPEARRPLRIRLSSVASIDTCDEPASSVVYISPVVASEAQLSS